MKKKDTAALEDALNRYLDGTQNEAEKAWLQVGLPGLAAAGPVVLQTQRTQMRGERRRGWPTALPVLPALPVSRGDRG